MTTATTLEAAIRDYGPEAYLLTIDGEAPHTSYVEVALAGDEISCVVGGTALRNIRSYPNVTLMWPPKERGGYNVIVNGRVALADRTSEAEAAEAKIAITKSVLHRPGQRPETSDERAPGVCPSDCRQLSRAS